MKPSPRSLLAGCGLVAALVMGSTAAAAPKFPQKPTTTKTLPQVQPKPGALVNAGLTESVSLTPRALYKGGVSMNVHRAVRVETTTNKVLMDKHTQLWLYFKGAANTDYDIDCRFGGTKSILVMDYASGKYVRQQSTSPSADGKLHHKVFARPNAENLKVYMQASGDLDWLTCTVAPS